ncbi:hypothetical protein GCM10027586_02020 [Kineococcus gypseus]|uniref:hypothetical protein n=1 Tax=Kineococcus gypseus TaxID=1637102 RepID=UPI003D7C3F0A
MTFTEPDAHPAVLTEGGSGDGTCRGSRVERADEGNLSLFVAVIAVALLAVIGLAYDGAAKVQATQQADLAAAEAARAAGQELNVGTAILTSGRSTPIDPAAAAAAANRYLAAAGMNGSAAVTGETVTVTTRVQWRPVLLTVVGVGPQAVEGHATARAANGITEETP